MFCFQCQETAKNQGCTIRGVCGKPEDNADVQDLLIHICKGISFFGKRLEKLRPLIKNMAIFYARRCL
jgi:hydroxylamine reductase